MTHERAAPSPQALRSGTGAASPRTACGCAAVPPHSHGGRSASVLTETPAAQGARLQTPLLSEQKRDLTGDVNGSPIGK